MKLVTFSHHGGIRIGALVSRGAQACVLDLSRAQPELPRDMLGLLNAGEAAVKLAHRAVASPDERYLVPEAQVTLLAPIPRPGKIICLGHNYYDHMGQDRTAPAEYPTIFDKTVNTVIGPGQPIIIPPATQQVDYEAELGVVIGKSFDTFGPMGPALVTADEIPDRHAGQDRAGQARLALYEAGRRGQGLYRKDWRARQSSWSGKVKALGRQLS